MRARVRITGRHIIGTLETCRGVAETKPGSFTRDASGGIDFEYAGDTRTWPEEQQTIERDGSAVFVDDKGNEFTSKDIELYETTRSREKPAAEPRTRTGEIEGHPVGANRGNPAAGREHPDATESTITVSLNHGVVETVNGPDHMMGQVTIRIEETDIEGLNEDSVETDADGRQYHLTTWP